MQQQKNILYVYLLRLYALASVAAQRSTGGKKSTLVI